MRLAPMSTAFVVSSPLVLVTSVFAQLISVRCCTEESHLATITDCVSGDGNLMRPATCPPGATCVLGFGGNRQLMGSLCDPRGIEIPRPTRAYCSSWSYETAPVAQECVARPNLGVSLFSVFDDDGDGDLDELDVAAFWKVYEPVPKLEQSAAVLTFVECCVDEAIFRLSGPGVTATPFAATCLMGFSKPVEPGDYLHKLCGSPPTDPPNPSESFCVAWQIDTMPPIYFCPAANFTLETLVIVSDVDGDSDVDLADFAVFQRDWEVELR